MLRTNLNPLKAIIPATPPFNAITPFTPLSKAIVPVPPPQPNALTLTGRIHHRALDAKVTPETPPNVLKENAFRRRCEKMGIILGAGFGAASMVGSTMSIAGPLPFLYPPLGINIMAAGAIPGAYIGRFVGRNIQVIGPAAIATAAMWNRYTETT